MNITDSVNAGHIDPHGIDDIVFGVDFVYCAAHCKPHATGWCTVRNESKTPLEASTTEEAYAEAIAMNVYIDGRPWPCHGCGIDLISTDSAWNWPGVAIVGERCSSGGSHRMKR